MCGNPSNRRSQLHGGAKVKVRGSPKESSSGNHSLCNILQQYSQQFDTLRMWLRKVKKDMIGIISDDNIHILHILWFDPFTEILEGLLCLSWHIFSSVWIFFPPLMAYYTALLPSHRIPLISSPHLTFSLCLISLSIHSCRIYFCPDWPSSFTPFCENENKFFFIHPLLPSITSQPASF